MTIAIDIRSLFNPHQTGVGQFTSGLLSALRDHTEHEYVLYYNAAKKISVPESLKDIGTLVASRYPNKILTVSSGYTNAPKIDWIIRRQTGKQIDLLYSPHTQYAPHSTGVPHIMTIPDLSFEHFSEYYTIKNRIWHHVHRVRHQAEQATAVVVPSESTKTDVIHTCGISADRVHVVYPGLQSAPDTSDDVTGVYALPERYFLFLGTIEPRKNIDTLIEAYQSGTFFESGIELIIAGAPGWKNADTMRAIETTSGVRYIGYVPESHKAALYRNALAFIYPSFYEGFGFPVLEAMQQGTPVITSNRTSLPEITQGQARLVHPHRVDEFVSAMRKYTTPQKQEYDVVSQYSWERAATQLDQLFQKYGR